MHGGELGPTPQRDVSLLPALSPSSRDNAAQPEYLRGLCEVKPPQILRPGTRFKVFQQEDHAEQ